MSTTENHEPRITPTASVVFDGGTIVEMLYQTESRTTKLVAWKGGQFHTADSIGELRPYSALNNLLTHGVVLFPSDVGECATEAALQAEVRNFIHRYADLSDGFEEVASWYVLLTWIYDSFNELPYLRLKGDFGSGKSRCLQVIGSLCYKPMFVSGASTVSPMFRIIDAFRGTLILDESDFRYSDEKAEIVKILNNGNAAGFPVLRSEITPTKEFNPRAFSVYGPKIIASRSAFDDRALESRCITETMSGLPPRPEIPLTLPSSFPDEATQLRNKLLRYRFENLQKVRDTATVRAEGMDARVSQIFAPLLAVASDPDAKERIRGLARALAGDLQAERCASAEAQLLDIIYEMRRDGASLVVRDIASRFGKRFGVEYKRPITARWIGGQLRRRLSLTPVKSNGVFLVSSADELRLVSLFERYGVGEDQKDVGTSAVPAGD
jgi:hypothetical protein